MYLWIGCQLPEAFSREIRGLCLSAPESIRADFTGYTLPQHISLKISFDAGQDYTDIADHIAALLRDMKPFSVHPTAIEGYKRILWICFQENPQLENLHNMLDQQLAARFGIRQHPFDKCFVFHSTLCMGDEQDTQALARYFSDYALPPELPVNTLLLGISETGKSGSYRVIRRIHL